LYERILNLFAAVDRRDDDQESAASYNQAQLSVSHIPLLVWDALVRNKVARGFEKRTCHGFFHFVQHEIHELVIAL
jgi:hypothetical protein